MNFFFVHSLQSCVPLDLHWLVCLCHKFVELATSTVFNGLQWKFIGMINIKCRCAWLFFLMLVMQSTELCALEHALDGWSVSQNLLHFYHFFYGMEWNLHIQLRSVCMIYVKPHNLQSYVPLDIFTSTFGYTLGYYRISHPQRWFGIALFILILTISAECKKKSVTYWP